MSAEPRHKSPKIILILANLSTLFKRWTLGQHFLHFGVGFKNFQSNIKTLKKISGKIVTSLANNFFVQKSLFKNIFGLSLFICKPIFKIFAGHFRTKGVLKHYKIIFVCGCFTMIREKHPFRR